MGDSPKILKPMDEKTKEYAVNLFFAFKEAQERVQAAMTQAQSIQTELGKLKETYGDFKLTVETVDEKQPLRLVEKENDPARTSA